MARDCPCQTRRSLEKALNSSRLQEGASKADVLCLRPVISELNFLLVFALFFAEVTGDVTPNRGISNCSVSSS